MSPIPILVYHRFGPIVTDAMTVTTSTFASHLEYLAGHGYTVIPLRALVGALRGSAPQPPPRSVVITADDGHRTVYSEMLPLVRRFQVPVTLFVYPSAISRADYALTWDQLRDLRATGLVDVQSHTFWHPNFRVEKRRLAPAAYDAFVTNQLVRSRRMLESQLDGSVDLLAWPFGIVDDELAAKAAAAGYMAGFTIERRHVRAGDSLLKLPRYLMTDADRGKAFEALLTDGAPRREPSMEKRAP
ncbi:MAG TPA: polysaccharide deacetylase family protein [Candidatus Eisenbacteria bacterium]|nr:polysaccharide deacetylase family protein [Candidatus Eisenbacteria bacterium]